MKKFLSTALPILLAMVVGALAHEAFTESTETQHATESQGIDSREAVAFNAEQAHHARSQMRGLLETLVQLDKAEADNDLATIASLAAMQGPNVSRTHPEGFQEAMPDGFRALSRQMRQSFGRAEAAASEGDLEAYITAKQEAQNACLACHASYRIDEGA